MTTISIKKSAVPGKVPSVTDLSYGELALNYADGILYYKSSANQIQGISATSLTVGTDTAISTSTGAITIWNTGTLQSVTGRGSSTTNSLSILNITGSTSTTTGALVVTGGVGIGGNLYAGNIYSNGTQLTPANIQEFTATANQTTFTIAGGYITGTVQVFANGVALGSSDFSASNGTSVILNTPRNLGDVIRVWSAAAVTQSTQSLKAFSIAMSIALG